jgi:hypothetical protein
LECFFYEPKFVISFGVLAYERKRGMFNSFEYSVTDIDNPAVAADLATLSTSNLEAETPAYLAEVRKPRDIPQQN